MSISCWWKDKGGWTRSLGERMVKAKHVATNPWDKSCLSSIYMTSLAPWPPCSRQQFARMTVGGGGAHLASGALVSSAAPAESSEEDSEKTKSEDDESDADSPAPPPPAYVVPVPTASNDCLAAPMVEQRVIAIDCVLWISPPAILSNWVGKWKKWEFQELQEEHAWIFKGKKAQLDSKCRYNRVLGRRLYFGQFDPPPGLLDWEHFGSPIPWYPFFPSQEEVNKYKGKRAEAPHYLWLPLVDNKNGSTNAGKGRVTNEEDIEGVYSSDEENGMEVDRVEPENPVSNVVTISDVNEGISAQTFRMMTADVFSHSNVHPLTILRARGLIWRNLRVVFQPNGEFDEAALYTTDVWLHEEEQDDDTSAPPYTPAPPMSAATLLCLDGAAHPFISAGTWVAAADTLRAEHCHSPPFCDDPVLKFFIHVDNDGLRIRTSTLKHTSPVQTQGHERQGEGSDEAVIGRTFVGAIVLSLPNSDTTAACLKPPLLAARLAPAPPWNAGGSAPWAHWPPTAPSPQSWTPWPPLPPPPQPWALWLPALPPLQQQALWTPTPYPLPQQLQPSLANYLAMRPDPATLSTRIQNLIDRDPPTHNGCTSTAMGIPGRELAAMRAEIDAQMEAELAGTATAPSLQAPVLFALSATASSLAVPMPAAQTKEEAEQSSAVQEEDEEMLNTPRRWTAWDDDNSGMGPYAG
ncbi:hypothetical protein DFH08DRAFT_969194 [Mycena albidolilacea]|uniref:Uncharacterized protein n=1 Tax=Mycena albidolilacea TaxID=1033008 RepID=A0AAD6ZJ58_9AGAR|nr:hypothetical protein DFH08DRAFT_969194 [Mycena albidolilacea]